MAAFSHAGLFVLSFILPLTIRLTAGQRDPFVRAHASEALNGQITFGIFWNVGIAATMIGSSATNDNRWFFMLIVSGIALLWILANSIIGAVHAYNGQPYRYVGNFRFLRGGFGRQ